MTDLSPQPDPTKQDLEVSVSFDPDQSLLHAGVIDPPVRPGLVGTLDRFELLKRIGVGGMGVVYLARDSSSGQRVAVKVLKPELLDHPAMVRHFLREARLMQALSHPNILPIIEVSDRPTGPYFATPLIESGSLASRIRTDGPLDPGTASDVARQVAEALDYCHKQGVIHRDIKPANVLLDREGRAYLCDLGLGQSLTDVSITYFKEDKRVGTAAYMAPEIVRGDAGDSRCDVYSFGAMLYEMLTGEPPYSGQTVYEVLAKIQAGSPEPILSVNPKADRLLTRIAEGAMARELRDRYATMADVLADLDRARAEHSVLGPRGTAKPKAISVGRLGLAAVSLCVLIGLVFLAYWRWPWREGTPGQPISIASPGPLTDTGSGSSRTPMADNYRSKQQTGARWWTADAYYPFNGNANDESGNGHNGTVNGADLCPDRLGAVGKAYSFDGSDDYIVVSNPPSVTTSLTMAAWIRLEDNGVQTGGYVINKGVYLTPSTYCLGVTANSARAAVAGISVGGVFYTVTNSVLITLGEWTHVAGVYDATGGGLTLYVNGKPVGHRAVSGSLDQNTKSLYFGCDRGNPGATWEGGIDEVYIFNKALGPDEVKALVHKQKKVPDPYSPPILPKQKKVPDPYSPYSP